MKRRVVRNALAKKAKFDKIVERVSASIVEPHVFEAGSGGECMYCAQPEDFAWHMSEGFAESVSDNVTDPPDPSKGEIASKEKLPKGSLPHKYVHPAGVDYTEGGFYPDCKECNQPLSADIHATPKAEVSLKDPEASPEKNKSFVVEFNGKTIVTAAASAFKGEWEKALNPNPHMLWMQGRLVGAEKANRNGAFWSTQDLEIGQPTVNYGPLNWLHDSKKIIGSLCESKVMPESSDADPHIAVVGGIWQWIYPEEAFVIEQASDQGSLYFSMECISNEVACIGDNGCGRQVSYGDYMDKKTCRHMIQKSATRRFVDPIFLGAAAIVPPVRPGWADANASIIRESSSIIERAYEDANSDMPASEWEILMAQILQFSGEKI